MPLFSASVSLRASRATHEPIPIRGVRLTTKSIIEKKKKVGFGCERRILQFSNCGIRRVRIDRPRYIIE
jgi:hypothetical protein